MALGAFDQRDNELHGITAPYYLFFQVSQAQFKRSLNSYSAEMSATILNQDVNFHSRVERATIGAYRLLLRIRI